MHFETTSTLESSSCENKPIEVCAVDRGQSFDPWNPPPRGMSNHSSLAAVVDESLRFNISDKKCMNIPWHFTENHLHIIARFRERTALTIGNNKMVPLYRDMVYELACKVCGIFQPPLFR